MTNRWAYAVLLTVDDNQAHNKDPLSVSSGLLCEPDWPEKMVV